jgi:glycosyltransferase involved in cell wall biosynthesis
VVIPCRNEGASIGPLLREIRQLLPNIIVIDDGSSDGTAAEARDGGAQVISHPTSQGKGAALRTGWERARTLGFTWVLCMDGDGQHAPTDIGKFLECAERTGAALVTGNRMSEANKIPFVRRMVNRWMSRKLSALAGCELPDTQCGFRLLSLDALDRIQLRATQFEIESEQMLAFAAAGERIEFVPIQVIYRTERSKIHPLRDTLRWFRWRRQWLQSSSRPRSHERRDTSAPSRR